MSEAREKLKAAINAGDREWRKVYANVEYQDALSDAILAAGFVLPEPPKQSPFERAFLDIAQVWLAETGTSYSRVAAEALARWHLQQLCEAYIQGVRDRCNNGGKNVKCNEQCRSVNAAGGPETECGELQREAKKRYGQ